MLSVVPSLIIWIYQSRDFISPTIVVLNSILWLERVFNYLFLFDHLKKSSFALGVGHNFPSYFLTIFHVGELCQALWWFQRRAGPSDCSCLEQEDTRHTGCTVVSESCGSWPRLCGLHRFSFANQNTEIFLHLFKKSSKVTLGTVAQVCNPVTLREDVTFEVSLC